MYARDKWGSWGSSANGHGNQGYCNRSRTGDKKGERVDGDGGVRLVSKKKLINDPDFHGEDSCGPAYSNTRTIDFSFTCLELSLRGGTWDITPQWGR